MTDFLPPDQATTSCGTPPLAAADRVKLENGIFSLFTKVPPDLIEPAYQHVHHADTLRLLERARLAYMAHIGFPNEHFVAQGLFVVLSKVDVSFLREVFAGETEITVQQGSCLEDGRTLVLNQTIYRVDSGRRKAAVEARIHSIFMSGATKRAISPPEDFLRAVVRSGADSRP